jgi:DNA-binding response OmpR family regulator/signal transduction histidine kinase
MIPANFTREYHVLAEICGSMSSGFMLLNQQQVIYSNASALRLLHIGKHDLVDTQEFDVRERLLEMAVDAPLAQEELDRLWLQPEREYVIELALTNASASTMRWLRVRSFPVRDKADELLGRGVLFDDITLERSALRMRNETLALAAHELKTPLAVIKGCATTLLGSTARWDPAMQREMLQMIDTQSDRLHDVLNTLLDVWKLDAGTQPLRLTQINIAELLNQLVKRWQTQSSQHRFTVVIAPNIAPVMCDAVRIEQVLNHLLNNAVKYSPANTTITVRLDSNDIEVRVAIADEGSGITPEHIERIFDRFYRVARESEQVEGSGLGLAAARATIEAHGGSIMAESSGHNQGTTCYFTLPFSPPLPQFTRVQGAAAIVPQVSGGMEAIGQRTHSGSLKYDRRVRVLLAESDPRMLRYLRANLEEQHYRVQTVNHGIQFLRQLDLEEPDIIILATRLADMSGVELLQRLREFSQIPVLMVCDDCHEDERVQLFDLGGDDLVMKPFSMKELLARVRALLRRHASAGETATQQTIFTTGDLLIDHAQHIVSVEGRPVQLSRTEYNLLNVLAQNAGMVVTHELLLEKVWGPEYHRDIDFIWVYISRLRRKVEPDPRHPRYILTVPDVGYKLAKIS